MSEPANLTAILAAWRTVIDAENATARTMTPVGSAVPRLIDAIDAVLKRHSPWRVYEPCDHSHAQGDSGTTDCDDFIACEAGYLCTICRQCCRECDGSQSETCAAYHRQVGSSCHPCPELTDIAAALTGGENPGG